MASVATWKGSKELIEQPNSPQITDTADGQRAVRYYAGPWEKALEKRPARGDITNGLDGFFVWETKLTHQSGGRGLLEVRLADTAADGQTLSTGGSNDEIEIDWIVLEKDLRTHPRYRIGGGGAKEQTQESLEAIDRKLKDPNAVIFEATSSALELYLKIYGGQTHYTIYAPVVQRRSIVTGKLNASSFEAGTLDEPPVDIGGDWQWRKTADRAHKVGGIRHWERREEWTGVDYWDTDIYS